MTIENWIQILVPIIGIILAVVSASLSYFFTKRNQLRADECRLKEKCYLDFIQALSDNVLTDNLDESRRQLSDAHNHILLIGSPDVVEKLRHFSKLISVDNTKGFTQEEHDISLTELIKSMRSDLYKNSKINNNYPIISLSGRHKRGQKTN